MVKVLAEWWPTFLQEEYRMVRGAWPVQMVEECGISSYNEQCIGLLAGRLSKIGENFLLWGYPLLVDNI